MSRRKALTVLAMSFVVLSLSLWVAAQEKPKTRTETKLVTKEELIKMQIESDRAEATPMQKSTMTVRQKEHQKLYKTYVPPGLKLNACPASKTGDIILQIGVGLGEYNPNPPSVREIFNKMAAGADTVIIGVVKEKTSIITEDENFIFTDYELQCDTVLKDFSTAPLKKNEKIIVTMPGGIVLKNDHLVKVVDENFLLLHKGLQYLLFLKYIPSTGAYQALDSKSSFLLLDNKVFKLTKEDFPIESYFNRNTAKTSPAGESVVDATSFLELVLSAINSASNSVN